MLCSYNMSTLISLIPNSSDVVSLHQWGKPVTFLLFFSLGTTCHIFSGLQINKFGVKSIHERLGASFGDEDHLHDLGNAFFLGLNTLCVMVSTWLASSRKLHMRNTGNTGLNNWSLDNESNATLSGIFRGTSLFICSDMLDARIVLTLVIPEQFVGFPVKVLLFLSLRSLNFPATKEGKELIFTFFVNPI